MATGKATGAGRLRQSPARVGRKTKARAKRQELPAAPAGGLGDYELMSVMLFVLILAILVCPLVAVFGATRLLGDTWQRDLVLIGMGVAAILLAIWWGNKNRS